MSRLDKHSQKRPFRVCILSSEEATQFIETGELPPHRCHSHIGKAKADELTSTLLYWTATARAYEAYWVGKGKRAIKFHEAKAPKATVGADGTAGIQWVAGGARWPLKA